MGVPSKHQEHDGAREAPVESGASAVSGLDAEVHAGVDPASSGGEPRTPSWLTALGGLLAALALAYGVAVMVADGSHEAEDSASGSDPEPSSEEDGARTPKRSPTKAADDGAEGP